MIDKLVMGGVLELHHVGAIEVRVIMEFIRDFSSMAPWMRWSEALWQLA